MEHLLAERVKEIMEDQRYSPSGFADTIDVPRPIMSHILSGRNKPSLDVIQKILMRFPELNPWWLLTGKGTMKQLNLFAETELESVSIKPTTVHSHNHNTSSPVAVSPLSKLEEKHTIAAEAVSPLESPTAQKNIELPPVAPINQTQTRETPLELVAQANSKGKTIEKMIVIYSDKTFSVYHPE